MSTDDKSQKTEEPTPAKLREARKKGQVVKSKDVTTTISLAAVFMTVWLTWSRNQQLLQEYITETIGNINGGFDFAFAQVIDQGISVLAYTLGPIIIAAIVSAVFGNVVQVGFLFAADQVIPKIERINPISGFKRIFGVKNFFEFLKSLIKFPLLALCILWVTSLYIQDILNVVYCDVHCAQYLGYRIVQLLCVVCILFFMILAVLDYLVQRHEFMKEQRMTKDELKRDRKNTDGDPMVKGERKRVQQDATHNDPNLLMREATIMINSGSRVIALKYEAGVTPLPLVLIKQKDHAGLRLIQIARQKNVPIFDEGELVNKMWDNLKVNEYISSDLINPVAGLIAQAVFSKK